MFLLLPFFTPDPCVHALPRPPPPPGRRRTCNQSCLCAAPSEAAAVDTLNLLC